MKKFISILLVFALVLSMGSMAHAATGDKPGFRLSPGTGDIAHTAYDWQPY